MKKIITIATVATLILSLGVVANAATDNRASEPEIMQGEQISAEAPEMNGEKPADLPEVNGQLPKMNGEVLSDLPETGCQPPQMNGEKPSGFPEMIDFDEMVKKGVISQETCDKIKAYMEEHKPADFSEMNGQPPQVDGQTSEESIPSDRPELPEMNGDGPVKGGLLNDLLSSGIITQTEYDALSEAITN